MHAELNPAKTIYFPQVGTREEIDDLLDWFVKN